MKHFRIIISLLILAVLLPGCGRSVRNPTNSSRDSLSLTDKNSLRRRPLLPPLEDGEIHVTDDIFGPTINLTGEPLNIKENIKPEQLFVKGNYLVTNNQRNDSLFMIFELPALKCIAAFGAKGNGPDEFGYPRIVETAEDSILFYIFDMINEKVYKVSEKRLSPEYYFSFPKQNRTFDEKQIVFIDSKTAYYVSNSAKGKMVYSFRKDSIPQEKTIKDLAIPGKKGSWTTVIGDFGINPYHGRMAYAYKYFKRLKIIDIQTMKERNIIFDTKELKKGLNDIATLEPTNITHYWGMSSNDEYFWMLYSGRTPIDVQRDNRNKKKYIYVEKFDWNGNPVRRYKLNDWGYFCVDEKNNTLYLASTASVYSLLKYNIIDTLKTDR